MASTVQDFYAAAQRGLSRDFLFRVMNITGHAGAGDMVGDGELVYATSAALPGRVIEDKVANYFGQEFHLGGRATYNNSSGYPIEFYCSEDAGIRKGLEAMSNATFRFGTGAYGIGDATIDLAILNKQLGSVATCKLVGAQIREIGDISYLIADGTGETVRFSATFAYQWSEIS